MMILWLIQDWFWSGQEKVGEFIGGNEQSYGGESE